MKSLKDFIDSVTTSDKKEEIGICLSGGGALGFAHIGVLQALEDYGIYPQVISGASMGSIIGVLYAAGYKPSQMMDFIKEGKLYKFTNLMNFKPTFWKSGLTDHTHLLSLLHELIPNNSFQKLEKEFYVCVSNLTKANWEIISQSNRLNIWIAASCSIPGIFTPLKINDMIYVDGGLLNNLPAQPLKKCCKHIIGVDVIPHLPNYNRMKPLDTFTASARVTQHINSKEGRELCDFLIKPMSIEKYHEFSFEDYQTIYQYGYRTTTKYINNHPAIIQLKKHNTLINTENKITNNKKE